MRTISYLQRYGNIELAVRRLGEGPPFIWGHSLMGSMASEDGAALWDWVQVEQVSEVVRFDARGHGNSDGSYDPEDYRWPQLAQDMLAVATAVTSESDWPRCILGGMSMGAATALEAACQQPDAVAGLVLVIPPTAWETRSRQAAIYRRMAWVSGLFGAAPYRLLELLPIPVREDGRSRLGLHTARGLAMANPLQVQAALRGASRSDLPTPEQLKELQVPTLLLSWSGDATHPLSTAEILAECLPDVRELVVCAPTDISEWLPAMLDFIEEVSSQ